MARRRKKKRRAKLNPEQRRARKIQRDHKKEVRSIFNIIGFTRLATLSDRQTIFQESPTDFDDIYIFKNIIAVVEYTAAREADLPDHLRKKRTVYDKILKNQIAFVDFLAKQSTEFRRERDTNFSNSQMKVVVAYCAVNTVKATLKRDIPGLIYLDFQIVKYFKAVTNAIKQSARNEFFHFLGLNYQEVGENVLSPKTAEHTDYAASLLPEEASHFKKGYKVVSFYVDPAALLEHCYVLRQDGWSEQSNLYQRMISKKKIEAIRKYLLEDKRVFINNIIVTLPANTEVLDSKGHSLDLSKVIKTDTVKIRLPSEYNSVGLVDGQHRVYSYYEGGPNEGKISKLRVQQNLLATGIIYPTSATATERTKFEAKLFLEINANQTNAKSDVKQAIGLLLNPYSAESIAKDVVNRLNDQGPLEGQFEKYFYEKEKLKTTSVVSYGIRHVVKPDTKDTEYKDSLYKTWPNRRKARLINQRDADLREEYVRYCVQQINTFIGAIKDNFPEKKWTADKKSGGMLSTTNINGFIVCLRKIIEKGNVHGFDYYKSKVEEIHQFNFGEYHSSQYGSLGEKLYNTFFARS